MGYLRSAGAAVCFVLGPLFLLYALGSTGIASLLTCIVGLSMLIFGLMQVIAIATGDG